MAHWRGKITKAFTLIEVLVSIAIIALLTTLMVPSIDRSLSRNNLANDVDLLRSKIEETRLMAGSTQQADAGTGYYGIFLPGGNNNYFAIVRLTAAPDNNTRFATPCDGLAATSQSDSGSGDCLVEKVILSKNVSLSNNGNKLVVYHSPTGQINEAVLGPGGWAIQNPALDPMFKMFNWGDTVKLKFKNKTATLKIEDYTGKLSAVYTDN